jgi:hypothetical protein
VNGGGSPVIVKQAVAPEASSKLSSVISTVSSQMTK